MTEAVTVRQVSFRQVSSGQRSPQAYDASGEGGSVRGSPIWISSVEGALAAGLAGAVRADLTGYGHRNDTNHDRAQYKHRDHDQPGHGRRRQGLIGQAH